MRIVDKNVKYPYMGHEFFVSSPVLTPVMRGWGIVGHYIDRCIISADAELRGVAAANTWTLLQHV